MSASTKIHGEPRPPAARGHGQLDGGGVRALDKKSPAATPASKGGNAGEPGKVLAFAGDQWHADVKKRLAELETKGKLKEADLDQGALKALKTLPYEVALACLEKIANERNAIRNINAFVVTNCTHLRNQWGLAPPAAPARDAQDDRVRLSRSSHAEESPGGGAPPAKKKKKAVWANMQLNKQILACEDAGELCALIQARVAEFDHVNVATAFRRLLQTRRQGVSRAVADQALWQLEASALLTMDDFQPQEISSTLHALAKARYAPSDPLLLDALERQAEAVAGTFNAQQVANTLWAYAKLGRAPGAGVMRGLEGRAEAVAGTFKAQEVANTLWAYATLGRAPGAGLRRKVEERILQLVEDFTSQDLADTQWAYGQLGMALPAEVVTGLEARHSAILASLSAFVAADPGRGVPEARCDADCDAESLACCLLAIRGLF
jgi:hypothetical protein